MSCLYVASIGISSFLSFSFDGSLCLLVLLPSSGGQLCRCWFSLLHKCFLHPVCCHLHLLPSCSVDVAAGYLASWESWVCLWPPSPLPGGSLPGSSAGAKSLGLPLGHLTLCFLSSVGPLPTWGVILSVLSDFKATVLSTGLIDTESDGCWETVPGIPVSWGW